MSAAEELSAEIGAVLQDTVRRFGLATGQGFFMIQQLEPVDTHRAQASNVLSAGAPSEYIEPEGSTHPLGGQDHVDAVLAELGDGDGEVWHSNNVPYAARLNYDGWSSQAPEPEWMENSYRASFAAHFPGGEG